MERLRFNKSSSETSKSFFKTSDLYLASYLRANRLPLKNFYAEKERGRIFFEFEDSGEIQRLVDEYSNNFPVPVLDYKLAVKDLKGIIMNFLRPTFKKE